MTSEEFALYGSDEQVREAECLGFDAARRGFPRSGYYNQYSCRAVKLHEAWYRGHDRYNEQY